MFGRRPAGTHKRIQILETYIKSLKTSIFGMKDVANHVALTSILTNVKVLERHLKKLEEDLEFVKKMEGM